jgi:hypothetical protein
MRRSQSIDEQITMALRQIEAGTPADEVCPKVGVSRLLTKSP